MSKRRSELTAGGMDFLFGATLARYDRCGEFTPRHEALWRAVKDVDGVPSDGLGS